MPEVFCLPLPPTGLLCIEQTEAFQRRLIGLDGAREIAYWDETSGQWEGLWTNHPLRVDPSARVLLIRRQDAFYLRGLGDALQFLEEERGRQARQGPLRPTAAATREEIASHCVSRLILTSCCALTSASRRSIGI